MLALRSPLFLPDFLFENHLSWWLAIFAIAATLAFVARFKNSRPLLYWAFALAIMTVLWGAVALSFDTPAERLHNAHRSLASAASSGNIEDILDSLSPTFYCTNLGLRLDPASPSQPKSDLDTLLKSAGIKEIHITAYQSTLSDGQSALTHLSLLTETNSGPFPSSWLLQWTDVPGSDWKISSAQLTKLNNNPIPPDQLIRQ